MAPPKTSKASYTPSARERDRPRTPLQRLLGPDWASAYATPEEAALADLIVTTIEELEMMTTRLNGMVTERVGADPGLPRRWEILADLGRKMQIRVPNH